MKRRIIASLSVLLLVATLPVFGDVVAQLCHLLTGNLTFDPAAGAVSNPTTVTPHITPSGCESYIHHRTSDANVVVGDPTGTYQVTSAVTLYAKSINCPGYADKTGQAAYTISGGGGTFTLVQSKAQGAGAGVTTCSVTGLSAIGTGHLLVVGLHVVDTVDTAANLAITSVSDGHSTFTHCSNCLGAETAGKQYSVDGSYTVSSVATGTSVAVNFAGATAGNVQDANCFVAEYSYSGSSISFDVSDKIDDSVSCNDCSGVELTLTGTNDVIVQGVGDDTTTNGFGGITGTGYTSPGFSSGDGEGWAGVINTSSGTAPTWTGQGAAAPVPGLAMAFKGN